VKVDNQASVEGVSHGQGGRVAFMRAHREGLEASVHENFGGCLINCMSLSSEMLYHARASTLTRSSTDFWPNLPASHGLHVYTNAVFGLWFGQFVHPDWDMFQSGHPAGAFHAAARAVSGSSIYVSDKPDAHDFELLGKLVLSDGRVLRARGVGVPTRDCLFADPQSDPVLYKVVNTNLESGVVGLFNARYREGGDRLSGTTGPADVPELSGERFALYLGRVDRLVEVGRDERVDVVLDTLEAEIATLVPVDRGIAVIGLVDKLNPAGAVTRKAWTGSSYEVALADGGRFCAYTPKRPTAVLCDGTAVPFDHEGVRLSARIPTGAPRLLRVDFT
jgi:raffinose synthase